MQHRIPRAIGAIGLAASLSWGLLIGTAVAATPNVAVGSGMEGNTSTTATAATPTMVGPNKLSGWYLWATNNDASTVSQFFLNTKSPMTAYGAIWYTSDDATVRSCPISKGQLACSFGQFRPGETIFVTAAFTTPSTATQNNTNCMPASPTNQDFGVAPSPTTTDNYNYACVAFQWGSSAGFVTGGNKSHGDAFTWYDFVKVNGNGDFSGQFPYCDPNGTCSNALLTVSNQGISANNLQSTAATAPQGAFNSAWKTTGIQVSDNFSVTCDTGSLCASLANSFFGQWSSVSVNSDTDFAPDWIQTVITLYKPGVNANQVDGVYHSSIFGEDNITTKCPNGPDASTPDIGCFGAVKVAPGNSLQITVWTHYNGNYRGW